MNKKMGWVFFAVGVGLMLFALHVPIKVILTGVACSDAVGLSATSLFGVGVIFCAVGAEGMGVF